MGISKIPIKDLIIPLIISIIVVSLNQLLLKPNSELHARIEYKLHRIKVQTPIINRILAITDEYKTIDLIYIETIVEKHETQHMLTGQVFKTQLIKGYDSTNFQLPSFIYNIEERKKLITDLNSIMTRRDLLDYDVFLAFEKFYNFYFARLPSDDNPNSMFESEWNDCKCNREWLQLLFELNTVCKAKLADYQNF
jgi:hypothetical protein